MMSNMRGKEKQDNMKIASLINKINPTISNAQKILKALRVLINTYQKEKQNTLKAKSIKSETR